MNIKKIDLLCIGSFSNFIWDDSIKYIENQRVTGVNQINKVEKKYDLGKVNIFYGENGTGKTTLSKLFRIINGDNSLVKDLIPWGSTDQSIDYRMVDEIDSFESENFKNNIKVFDKKYIKEQVGDFIFDADESTEQNKVRGDYFLLVGDFVSKEKDIQVKEKKHQEEASLFQQEQESVEKEYIEYKILYGSNFEQVYQKMKLENTTREEVEKKLEEKKENKKLQEAIVQQTETVTNMSSNLQKFTKIKLTSQEDIDVFSEILGDTINFEYGEKTFIQSLIQTTKDNDINYCLLCNQDIRDEEGLYITRITKLISALLEAKADTISTRLLNIGLLIDQVESLETFKNTLLSNNKKIHDQYSSIKKTGFLPYPEFTFLLDEQQKKTITTIRNFISAKQNKLSERIDIGDCCNLLNDIIDEINLSIDSYNSSLDRIEKDIESIKLIKATSNSISDIDIEIGSIEKYIKIILESSKIETFLTRRSLISVTKTELETEEKNIKDAKDLIREEFSQFTKSYGIILKYLLDLINPSLSRKIDFNLSGTYSQGRGRCGFEIKHATHDNIITRHLSDGEKRSIAFVYFLSQFYELDEEKTPKLVENYGDNLMIVFDDPSTDYDKNNKAIIASMVVEISKGFDQTFIFTHDEKFRDYVIKQTDINPIGGDIKRYKITKNYLGYSSISILDKNQVDINHLVLKNSLISQNPDLSCVAHALRYCVEYMICNDLLGGSESSVDLLVKTKLGGKGYEKLTKANEKNSEFRSLYTFCNNNGSHYGEADGFEPLAENIRKYFEVYDYIFDKKNMNDINNLLSPSP